jgi:hypothetical protein
MGTPSYVSHHIREEWVDPGHHARGAVRRDCPTCRVTPLERDYFCPEMRGHTSHLAHIIFAGTSLATDGWFVQLNIRCCRCTKRIISERRSFHSSASDVMVRHLWPSGSWQWCFFHIYSYNSCSSISRYYEIPCRHILLSRCIDSTTVTQPSVSGWWHFFLARCQCCTLMTQCSGISDIPLTPDGIAVPSWPSVVESVTFLSHQMTLLYPHGPVFGNQWHSSQNRWLCCTLMTQCSGISDIPLKTDGFVVPSWSSVVESVTFLSHQMTLLYLHGPVFGNQWHSSQNRWLCCTLMTQCSWISDIPLKTDGFVVPSWPSVVESVTFLSHQMTLLYPHDPVFGNQWHSSQNRWLCCTLMTQCCGISDIPLTPDDIAVPSWPSVMESVTFLSHQMTLLYPHDPMFGNQWHSSHTRWHCCTLLTQCSGISDILLTPDDIAVPSWPSVQDTVTFLSHQMTLLYPPDPVFRNQWHSSHTRWHCCTLKTQCSGVSGILLTLMPPLLGLL